MPGMGSKCEFDAEDDITITVPQPIFEVLRAPSLKFWSQSAILTFLRDRRQYEEKIEKQCRITGEVEEAVVQSVRSTIDLRVSEYVPFYIL